MALGACKEVINGDTQSAMETADRCMLTFHLLVDREHFKELARDVRERYYGYQMEQEDHLRRALEKFCETQRDLHLEMGKEIDQNTP